MLELVGKYKYHGIMQADVPSCYEGGDIDSKTTFFYMKQWIASNHVYCL